MKRSESAIPRNTPHVLSFVTNSEGDYLAVHADLAGINLLIQELEILREQLELNDCPHTHLSSPDAMGEKLTTTKLEGQKDENNVISHVKIYGWNEEWAARHGLKKETA